DFAVLARAHASLDPVALALRNRGVRFRRVGMRGLYTRPEVLLCLNLLRAVAAPDDGASVYMALADPLFGADPGDLARPGARARRPTRALLLLAERATGEDEVKHETRDAIARFVELHRRLARSAARRPTSEVLYELVSESGLLTRLAADESAEAVEQVQNLNKL